MIPVVFVNYNDDVHRGAWWDQSIVEWMLANSRHDLQIFEGGWKGVPDSDGCIVVTPGHYDSEGVEKLTARIRHNRWTLLIVTSDELDAFPWWEAKTNGRLIVWRQHPVYHDPDRILPLGPPPHAIDMQPNVAERDLAWYFAGQITHGRRDQLREALKPDARGGHAHYTEAFLTGVPIDEYMLHLGHAQLAPAPSGPHTADTFRLYEALEAGAVPVVDVGPMRGDARTDYWEHAFHTSPPFQVVDHWSQFAHVRWSREWKVRCEAWWQLEKRDLRARLDADISDLSGIRLGGATAIVTTSPIPSHPSTKIIAETIDSIVNRCDFDVIVAADGVRQEQDNLRERYTEYLDELVYLSRTRWKGRVWVDYSGEWLHQAGTVKRAMRHIFTPNVLLVEHDTPLVGEIPFDRLESSLQHFDVIRLHHEAEIHPEHRSLLQGPPVDVGGDRFQPTVQWSQRPHLASVSAYERVLSEFPDSSRTMIEDLIHSVAQRKGYEWVRIAIYAPDGDIKRSTHLDGREGALKYEMRFQ